LQNVENAVFPSAAHKQLSILAQPSTIKRMTHLQQLEAESVHIMREVVAEAAKPVMLYSVGKDSAVMLHLARKAFFPAPPPFLFAPPLTGGTPKKPASGTLAAL